MTPQPPVSRGFVLRVLIKAALLFAALNLLFAATASPDALGRLSIYNTPLVPGRERLPFGENPASYNLSLFNLEAMLRSHAVAAGRPAADAPAGEYRVLLIGDSSVWGILLEPPDTLAGQLNARGLTAPDGRAVRVYNLGYPTLSALKDLLILDRAMAYRPDLIIWLTTLEAMPANKQIASPIVQRNAQAVRALIARYDLPYPADDPGLVEPGLWDRTLIGSRRDLADLLRLNVYGLLWAATGIDQYYPETYTPRQEDLEPSAAFYDLQPPLTRGDLALDVLEAGIARADAVPVLIVNEPIFISRGRNSDLRYNFYYPRWAYDDYRRLMAEAAQAGGWRYLDVWDRVPGAEFTNSAIHLTPAGTALLADAVEAAMRPLMQP